MQMYKRLKMEMLNFGITLICKKFQEKWVIWRLIEIVLMGSMFLLNLPCSVYLYGWYIHVERVGFIESAVGFAA